MRTYRYKPFRGRIFFCIVSVFAGVESQAQEGRPEIVKIQVDPQTVVASISPNFIGFGYESSAVALPHYFGGKNDELIQLYRNLSDHGLIRIGGIISDNTRYVPDGTPEAHDAHQVTIINQKSLADLGEFTRATGWKVMWGLNLGKGTKEEAITEAVAVDAALGSQLQSFEIGNEVENLSRFKKSYEAYHAAYLDYKAGIRQVIPKAAFSGPDSVGNWEWITKFIGTEAGDIKLLTEHYYCGDAHDAKSTLEKMLSPNNGWEARLTKLQQLCQDNGIHYRINEVNSFSSGGRPGVSDTFASALWCLDYMFQLASHGGDGVNMETDINQLGFISHYSPIVRDPTTGKCGARPEYYGMLAFTMAGKGDLLKLSLDKGPVNLSSYATKDETGSIWITVVNKDFSQDADVEASVPEKYATAKAFWLKAPSIESKDQVTFAGAEVGADGKWTPGSSEPVTVQGGTIRLLVPHASAVLLQLQADVR